MTKLETHIAEIGQSLADTNGTLEPSPNADPSMIQLDVSLFIVRWLAVLGVCCEPLSGLVFPANREKYRENRDFDPKIYAIIPLIALNLGEVLDLNSNLRSELNRELSPEYQGISIP